MGKNAGTHGGISANASNGLIMSTMIDTPHMPADLMHELIREDLPSYPRKKIWAHLDGANLTLSVPNSNGDLFIRISDEERILFSQKLPKDPPKNLFSILISNALMKIPEGQSVQLELIEHRLDENHNVTQVKKREKWKLIRYGNAGALY